MFILFLCERETAWSGERQRERETQDLKQALGSELSAQSLTWGPNPWTTRSSHELKLVLNRLGLPCAPRFRILHTMKSRGKRSASRSWSLQPLILFEPGWYMSVEIGYVPSTWKLLKSLISPKKFVFISGEKNVITKIRRICWNPRYCNSILVGCDKHDHLNAKNTGKGSYLSTHVN